MTKTCSRCKEEKPLDDFPKKRRYAGGRAAMCGQCLKVKQREWWKNSKVGILERLREVRKEKKDRNKAYRTKNPDKRRAGLAVGYAVRCERLPKVNTLKCAIPGCNEQATHYHHWSYAQEHWLSVIPVCIQCHADIHREGIILQDPQSLAV